jgi:flagellar assembly factor FliW
MKASKEGANMKIETLRFGTINYSDEHIIHFRDGVIGLSKLKDYILVESPGFPLILWLQSIQDHNVAFPLIEPYFFTRDYKATMTDADRLSLDLNEGSRSKIMVIMTIPKDYESMTVNMKAPIVFNMDKSLGTQVVLQDKTHLVRTPAFEGFNRAMNSQNPKIVQEIANDWNPVRLGNEAAELSSSADL